MNLNNDINGQRSSIDCIIVLLNSGYYVHYLGNIPCMDIL